MIATDLASHCEQAAKEIATWPAWKRNVLGEITMTMPHLMNCQHWDCGWCQQCVKEMYEEDIPVNEFCERMASRAKADLKVIREDLKQARIEVSRLDSEIRDVQDRCPHIHVVTHSSNSHELPDYSKCDDCGLEL